MKSRKPNVIVFFTDQQRWDSTGIHGNPMKLTPNFDRMAMGGTHIFNAFTCQPVCMPARSSLQTGLYATNTNCWTNGGELKAGIPTLADHFNEAGYRTGYIGKWHLCKQQIVPENLRGGYKYWLGANCLEFSSQAYDCVMYDGEGKAVKLPGYRVDAQADAAIRFIDANQNDPFFLFCSFLEPHFQNQYDSYPAPDVYAETINDPWIPPDLRKLTGTSPEHLPGYYGMVKRLDDALGRIIDAVKSLGLSENTIIIFTSDHGCHFKTRNSEYKRSCHESSIRIPMALTGPGFFGGGRKSELVSLVDLCPTLLDACGIKPKKPMQGRSFLPLIHGQCEDWQEEVFVQISESQVGRAVRTHRWKYGVNAVDAKTNNDQYASEYAEEYLYDLREDPYETRNLAGIKAYRHIADIMMERLLRRMKDAGEPKAVITAAPERSSGQLSIEKGEEWK